MALGSNCFPETRQTLMHSKSGGGCIGRRVWGRGGVGGVIQELKVLLYVHDGIVQY